MAAPPQAQKMWPCCTVIGQIPRAYCTSAPIDELTVRHRRCLLAGRRVASLGDSRACERVLVSSMTPHKGNNIASDRSSVIQTSLCCRLFFNGDRGFWMRMIWWLGFSRCSLIVGFIANGGGRRRAFESADSVVVRVISAPQSAPTAVAAKPKSALSGPQRIEHKEWRSWLVTLGAACGVGPPLVLSTLCTRARLEAVDIYRTGVSCLMTAGGCQKSNAEVTPRSSRLKATQRPALNAIDRSMAGSSAPWCDDGHRPGARAPIALFILYRSDTRRRVVNRNRPRPMPLISGRPRGHAKPGTWMGASR